MWNLSGAEDFIAKTKTKQNKKQQRYRPTRACSRVREQTQQSAAHFSSYIEGTFSQVLGRHATDVRISKATIRYNQ